jgi:endonuclease/exonuclease/phosphatase family metal-dependent hydrolase
MRIECAFAFLALMTSTCFVETAASARDGSNCIQIGTYNIEFFGGKREPLNGVDRGVRSDEQIRELADRVSDELDLEIVVYEEINTHSGEWKRYKELLARRGYQFFEGTASDRNQFVVLSWDANEVECVKDSAHELDVRNRFDFKDGCLEKGLRKPVAARFTAGEFDFWVIGVHMKSRKGVGECPTRVRIEQSKDLAAKIDELIEKSGESDVLIVGDFNSRPGHASFAPLVEAGFVSQMKTLMPGSSKGSYVKNKELHQSSDLIDQVMLRAAETREVVPNSAFVVKLGSADEATKYILGQSDHVPAWVSFRTDKDLD